MPGDAEVAETIPFGMPTAWLAKFAPSLPALEQVLQQRKQLDATSVQMFGKPATKEMVWAMAMVLSRSFGLTEQNDQIVLTPFIDMLNHGRLLTPFMCMLHHGWLLTPFKYMLDQGRDFGVL
jgi:hypothetical protein